MMYLRLWIILCVIHWILKSGTLFCRLVCQFEIDRPMCTYVRGYVCVCINVCMYVCVSVYLWVCLQILCGVIYEN